MKKNTHLVLFICFCFTVHFSVSAQIKIPGVQQQPQWAMPFMFEDANGYRDTVWIGYDPDASLERDAYDSVYNEYQYIDTSKFKVILCPTCYSPNMTFPADSAWKINIQSSPNPSMNLGFINGKMPITMYWVDSLFYSDSLPFPDISPRPRGRGNFYCDNGEPPFQYCRFSTDDPPFILSDYWYPEFQYTLMFSDSFYFDGSGNMEPAKAIGIGIGIVPHNEPYLGIDDVVNNPISINPLPATSFINIESSLQGSYSLAIIDMQGVIRISEEKQFFQNTVQFDIAGISPGMYILQIRNGKSIFHTKIIKQ
jgi:type IX secretion system substrate protein